MNESVAKSLSISVVRWINVVRWMNESVVKSLSNSVVKLDGWRQVCTLSGFDLSVQSSYR